MPYVISWSCDGTTVYRGRGNWSMVSVLEKARVYSSLGAVQNSLAHEKPGPETQIIELKLQPTGVVLNAAMVMGALQVERQMERQMAKVKRVMEERLRQRALDLAEMKRLKLKILKEGDI